MSDQKEATLWLKIKQTGTEILGSIADNIDNIGIIAGSVFALATAAIAKTVAEFGEADQGVQQLNRAMINAGVYTEDLSKQYVDLASNLQKVTAYSDDEIIAAQRTIQQKIGNMKVTEDLTKAVLDFAAAEQMDVVQAADLVGKTIGTQTNALARQGIEIDTTKSKTEKLTLVVQQLNNRSKDQATTAAQGIGSFKQLKNAVSDLAEDIGAKLAPMVFKATGYIIDLFRTMKENQTTVTVIASVLAGLAAVSGSIVVIAGLTKAFIALTAAATALGVAVSTIAWPVAILGAAAAALGYYAVKSNEAKASTTDLKKEIADIEAQLKYLNDQLTRNRENLTSSGIIDMNTMVKKLQTTLEEKRKLLEASAQDEKKIDEKKEQDLELARQNAARLRLQAQAEEQNRFLAKKIEGQQLAMAMESEDQQIRLANMVVQEEEKLALINTAEQAKLDAMISFFQKRADAEQNAFKKSEDLKKVSDLNLQKAELQKTAFELQQDQIRKKNREDTLATIATMQNSSNKELAFIGKAAALTQIAIETPVAIAKAIAAFPPPFGIAAGVLVGAAMAAQAAQVAGIPLAEGGIVKATPGGVPAIIGEGGKDEAVIPLDGNNPLGGNTYIFQVYGGMLGDERTAGEFAVAVDRQLYKLRQEGGSIAFDGRV